MSKKKVTPENSLATLYPEVAAQWHPTRNGDLTPDGVISGSEEKAWWTCRKGADHVWLAVIRSRTRLGAGCPSCAGKRVSGTNSLAALHPMIAAQWHPTKNGDLTPDGVVAGSERKAWWKCPQSADHVWLASISRRTGGGSGCPYCAGQKVSGTNSLAASHPQIAAQWHPTLNGELTPDRVVAGSNKTVWWKCSHGADHVWRAAVNGRTQGRGCPSCAGKKPSTTNSLAALYPEIAAQWHPTKNGDLTPEGVTAGSGKKAWWKCPKGADHVWLAPIHWRAQAGSGCPSCASLKVSTTNSLAARYPEIAAQWHPTLNGDLTPDVVVAGSGKKAWWQCPLGADHVWRAETYDRTQVGRGCPACAGKRVSASNSLAARYPEIAAQWHPTLNGDLTPDVVVAGSGKKAWWKCPRGADHVWRTTLNSRTCGGTGSGCPCCAGLKASTTNSLAALHPEIAAQWHPTRNGHLTPDGVTAGAHHKAWWQCPQGADHVWLAMVSDRTHAGTGCPSCAGRKVSSTNSLAALQPEIAAQWHPTKNGDLTPEGVTAGSPQKVWWKCPQGADHVWLASINQRTGRGSGCPDCRGWTKEVVRRFVTELRDHLHLLSPAELYTILQQSGLLATKGSSREFIHALVTGQLPLADVDRFIASADSSSKEGKDEGYGELPALDPTLPVDAPEDDGLGRPHDGSLPVANAADVLAATEVACSFTSDETAVQFLVANAVAKIWKHAYHDAQSAVEQAASFSGGGYAERVKAEFLREYSAAVGLTVPHGYSFTIDGAPMPPNLMQRHVAAQVRDRRR